MSSSNTCKRFCPITWLSLLVMCATWLIIACAGKNEPSPQVPSAQQAWTDSLSFFKNRHYGQNYNFMVSADSIALLRQMPEEAVSNLPIDSFYVAKGEMLVVADIRVLPNDAVDSVWVQLAKLDGEFGWIHEQQMLSRVVPDEPVSQFISFFSNKHLSIFMWVLFFGACAYGLLRLFRDKAPIVHFRDIPTFYPTLLTIVVAIAATFYSSIQMFAPERWQEFYFHPSLNPFSQPLSIGLFLFSVWGIVIVAIAAIDDSLRHLSVAEAVPYLLGVAGVCVVNYLVFTLSTLCYVGYPLLLAYIVFAVYHYLYHTRSKYVCGNCGKQIKKKGRCPHCGAVNE